MPRLPCLRGPVDIARVLGRGGIGIGAGSSVCNELLWSPLAAAELLLGSEERGHVSTRVWFPQQSTGTLAKVVL